MTDLVPVTTPAAVSARDERTVRLGDLGIARENLRFNQPPDDDIPLLAATLKAAGQLERLTVRPRRGREEKPFLALNGRRRLLAFGLLLEAGDIGADHPVQVYVETDPARQAAAALLTNTAVPLHVADVITAIGRMLKAKLSVPVIARALGYSDLEIRRLAALSNLPAIAIEALRQGRLTLKQARLLARLPDRKAQVELAEAALAGYGFQDWRITDRLNADRVTRHDRRCALVGDERYGLAGGRTETDLFGELPPVLLDPDILNRLWVARARSLALVLEQEGLEVHVTTGAFPDLPDDLEPVAYAYGQLDASGMAAYQTARDRYHGTLEAVRETGASAQDADPALLDMIRARVAMDQAGSGDQIATVLVLTPSSDVGLDIRCFGLEVAVTRTDADAEETEDAPSPARPPAYAAPQVEAPEPETEGVKHALHAMRTDVATRGLIRALADDPGAALVVLIAGLFSVLVAGVNVARSDSISTVTATVFGSRAEEAVETLDGVVRDRLDARRAAWQASGQTILGWVGALPHGEKMAFLAELTAISLDGRESRTDLIRNRARAEAAEVADLVAADITQYWTPDVRFLRPHAKPQLLDMLVEMKAEDVRAASLKKDELVDWVAEQAASRAWAPSSLSWSLAADPAAEAQTAGDETVMTEAGGNGLDDKGPDDDPGDGSGAFVVTPAGEAVLQTAAA